MVQTELETLNQRELRKLLLSIRASSQRLDLLLAICDDRNLQEQLIQTYEQELHQQGITPYETRLNIKQPSLRSTLEDLVERYPALQAGEKSVVTVLGATELLGVRLTEATSEQDRFFHSLQWTREALREFQFPIVLWLSDRIATRLSQQAPDFWSWRGGVFEFAALPQRLTLLQPELPDRSTATEANSTTQSPEDLLSQITAIEQQNLQSPLLVSLYNNLGEAYEMRYHYDQALQAYYQALQLAEKFNDLEGQAQSLNNLGHALDNCGRSLQAIEYYQESLAIKRKIGSRLWESNTLNNLGVAYSNLGNYEQAINLFEEALTTIRETIAPVEKSLTLSNLGTIYSSLGDYQKAISLYEKALAISREANDPIREGNALGNLGNAYFKLGNYQQAIKLYEEVLALKRKIGDRLGEGDTLGNLGNIYASLDDYQKAIDLYKQALATSREVGNLQREGLILNNLGNAYFKLGDSQQAIPIYKGALAIRHEINNRPGEASTLFNLGLALEQHTQCQDALEAIKQARSLYQEMGLETDVEACNEVIRRLSD